MSEWSTLQYRADVHLRPAGLDRAYVLEHLHELVVEGAANESGGYGMLMGPFGLGSRSRSEFKEKIKHDYAQLHRPQPLVTLSACAGRRRGPAPRHVDLRPYIVSGKST